MIFNALFLVSLISIKKWFLTRYSLCLLITLHLARGTLTRSHFVYDTSGDFAHRAAMLRTFLAANAALPIVLVAHSVPLHARVLTTDGRTAVC